jgi:quinol monooxygenase YgiN
MIVEHTQYKIDEKRKAPFEQAYRKAVEALASLNHYLRYELSRSAENPDYYTLRIEWDSEEGHLNGFRSSPEFKTFLSLVRPYVRDIQEMCCYEVIERTGNQAEANPFTSA